jgi:cytoskeleton protein RodZ
MSEQPGDYGRYLQTHRRAKAMSLEVVSQKTKISMTCLRQIENEDGAGLPAPTFVKGFIRAYAEVVGADAQEALNRYETNIDVHRRQSESDMAGTDTPGAFWGRMLLAFLLLTALIGGTIYFIQRLERPAQSAPMDKAMPLEAPSPLQPPDSPGEIPVPVKGSAVAETLGAQEGSQAVARLPPGGAFLAESWCSRDPLELSGSEPPMVTREMTLQPGHTATVEARSHIGNAGGILLALNDQPVSVPGRSGQVVTLQLP